MKKKIEEPKSFGKAMFSMAQLFQDYSKIDTKPQTYHQQQKTEFKIQKPISCMRPPVKKVVEKQSLPKPAAKIVPKPIVAPQKGIVLKQSTKQSTDQITITPKKLQKIQISQQLSSYTKPLLNTTSPIQTKYATFQLSKFILNPHMQFYYQGHDLRQGGLGDCYLISAISCLANKGNILNRCIQYLPSNLINSSKQFICHIYDSGALVDVKVKNLFSVIESSMQPAYVKPIDSDITPMVIEKAYAQIYGGYENIVLGYSCDALRDLSGAPTKYIDLSSKDLIEQITDAFQMGYVLTISSKVNPISQGIHKRHCYVVCDYKVHKGTLWLQLRNPTGYTPMNGIIKQQTDFKQELLQPNGVFWLSHNYLINNFQVISSCLIRPKYHYTYKSIPMNQLGLNYENYLMLQTNQVIHGYLTLHQHHTRHFNQPNKNSNYTYEVGKLIVARIQRVNNNSYKVIQTIGGSFNCKQTCTIQLNLTPGRYLLFSQLSTPSKLLDKSRIFTLSLYTSSPFLTLSSTPSISPDTLLYNYIKNHASQFQVTTTDKMTRYFGVLFGWVVIMFESLTEKTAWIDIVYDVKNVKPETGKVVVEGGGWKIVKNQIGKENNCSHRCAIKVNTVYK